MSVHTNETCDEESLMLSCTHKNIFIAINERLVPLHLKMCKISKFKYMVLIMLLLLTREVVSESFVTPGTVTH